MKLDYLIDSIEQCQLDHSGPICTNVSAVAIRVGNVTKRQELQFVLAGGHHSVDNTHSTDSLLVAINKITRGRRVELEDGLRFYILTPLSGLPILKMEICERLPDGALAD